MPFEQDAVVVEIKADFDPYSGEYTHISLGYRMPVPMPPTTQRLPPQPQPVMYKHVVHIIVPRENWVGQYTMWEQVHVVVNDNGEVKITKKK